MFLKFMVFISVLLLLHIDKSLLVFFENRVFHILLYSKTILFGLTLLCYVKTNIKFNFFSFLNILQLLNIAEVLILFTLNFNRFIQKKDSMAAICMIILLLFYQEFLLLRNEFKS